MLSGVDGGLHDTAKRAILNPHWIYHWRTFGMTQRLGCHIILCYDQKALVIALGDHQLAGRSVLIYSSFEKLIWWKVTCVFWWFQKCYNLHSLLISKQANEFPRRRQKRVYREFVYTLNKNRSGHSTSNQANFAFVELRKASLSLFPFILRKDSVVWVARPCVGGVFSWLPKDASYTTCSVFNESTITHNWQKLSGALCIQLEQLRCWLPWTSSQIKTSDPLH